MKLPNTSIAAAFAAVFTLLSGPASHAQSAPAAAPSVAVVPAELTNGEIKKIDLESKKITIKHGPLKSLGMPGMTMVFYAADDAMLNQVKAGDNVRFSADKVDGKFMVTKIEPAK